MSSRALTFGVEEEFLLVDTTTGLPAERNLAVVEAVRAGGTPLALEFTRCQVEIDTGVHTSATQLGTELAQRRRLVAQAARAVQAHLLAVAAPPNGNAPFQLTDSDRFARIHDRFGGLTNGQCICGCHVHVGMPDRETALQVSNFIRPWLPTLLALSANSAVHGGRDTGYASWRAVLQTGWPVSGPPPFFTSVEHYERLLARLQETGAILEEHMAYWDIRPSSHLPTVEIRVCDVPATVEETVTLATLIRALAMTALTELQLGRTAADAQDAILRAAKWRAAHDGLPGYSYDFDTGTTVPTHSILASLVRTVTPALEELGALTEVQRSLGRRLVAGNGAMRQRALLQSGGIDAVVTAAAAATVS